MAPVNSPKSWLLAGLVIAAGVGLLRMANAGGAGAAKVRKGDRLLLMGDSLGYGLSTPMKGLVTDAKELQASFLTTACGGTATFQYTNPQYQGGCSAGTYCPNPSTTSSCQTMLGNALQSFQPTLVLVSLGTNDAYGTVKADVIMQAALDLVKTLQASGARVAWIGPPKLTPVYAYDGGSNTLRPEIIDQLRKVLTEAGVPWFESSQLDIPQTDGIHANAKGYAGWAANIWNWLQ